MEPDAQAVIPQTMDECCKALDALLGPEEADTLRRCPPGELFEYHFSLGLWIRNHWVFPAAGGGILAELRGIYGQYADEMSMYLIKSYHNYLNGRDFSPPKAPHDWIWEEPEHNPGNGNP